MKELQVTFIDLGPHLKPAGDDASATYALFKLSGGDEESIHRTLKEVMPKVGSILSDRKVSPEEGLELVRFFEPGLVEKHKKVFEHIPTAIEALNGFQKAKEDGWSLSDLKYALPLLERLF